MANCDVSSKSLPAYGCAALKDLRSRVPASVYYTKLQEKGEAKKTNNRKSSSKQNSIDLVSGLSLNNPHTNNLLSMQQTETYAKPRSIRTHRTAAEAIHHPLSEAIHHPLSVQKQHTRRRSSLKPKCYNNGPHNMAEIYEPLNKASDQIRLLEYIPQSESTSWDHIPSFRLVVKSLSENPEYSALSYMWGEEKASEKIHLEVQVRPNLANALQHIIPVSTSYLWIDALCINQGDTSERNHQVGQTGNIYRQAQQVLIWLGAEVQFDKRREVPVEPDAALCAIKKLAAAHEEVVKMGIAISIDEILRREELTALEVLLASNLRICWGHQHNPGLRSVSWTEWDQANNALKSLEFLRGQLFQTPKDNHELGRILTEIRISLPSKFNNLRATGQKSWAFPELLKMSRWSICQEPHDKIYALLGLTDGTQMRDFSIDYSRPLFDIYTDLVIRYSDMRPTTSQSVEALQLSRVLQLMLDIKYQICFRTNMIRFYSQTPKTLGLRFFNGVGIFQGTAVASNVAKNDLQRRINTLFPETRMPSYELPLNLDLCRTTSLQMFNGYAAHVTKSNGGYCYHNKPNTAKIRYEWSDPDENTIFVTSRKEIGISPFGLKENDLVYRFKDTDITVIVRLQSEKYRLVGRAIIAADQVIENFSEPMVDDETHRFCLDIPTLQALTSPLDEFNYKLPDLDNFFLA
ncbi:hypothetical protein NHQ30_008110 [Ciborinia camelliae]|nr:hypothetical protein NHQ30_008110 [Ciborinia camelliae]